MPFCSRKTGIAFSCETLMFLYAFIPSCCCLAQALSDLSVEQWVCCVVCCVVLCAAGAGGGKQAQRKVTLRVTGATPMPADAPLVPADARWCPPGPNWHQDSLVLRETWAPALRDSLWVMMLRAVITQHLLSARVAELPHGSRVYFCPSQRVCE